MNRSNVQSYERADHNKPFGVSALQLMNEHEPCKPSQQIHDCDKTKYLLAGRQRRNKGVNQRQRMSGPHCQHVGNAQSQHVVPTVPRQAGVTNLLPALKKTHTTSHRPR